MSRQPPFRRGSAPPSSTPGRKAWSRPLAALVGKAIDPVLARQGFSEADLILNWEDIVGERLAANSRPIKLQWPPRPAAAQPRHPGAAPVSATLLVRVEGAFAPELQHLADQVLARVNAHLGWRCVGRLALRQGPLQRAEAAPATPPAPAPAAVEAATAEVASVEDEALRAALVRLGSHVLTRRR